jgi:hypothetical protein
VNRLIGQLWRSVGGLGEATERDGPGASVTGGTPVPGSPGSSLEVTDFAVFANLPDGILNDCALTAA